MWVTAIGDQHETARGNLLGEYPSVEKRTISVQYRPSRAEGNCLGKIWGYFVASGWTWEEQETILAETPPVKSEVEKAAILLSGLLDSVPVL
jgi:hypothetical protein